MQPIIFAWIIHLLRKFIFHFVLTYFYFRKSPIQANKILSLLNKNVESKKFKQCGNKLSLENCVICQRLFEQDDFARELRCYHVFHTQCIDEWVSQQEFSTIQE